MNWLFSFVYDFLWKVELVKQKYEEYKVMSNFMEEHKWVM